MKKKILVAFFSLLCIMCCAFLLSACDDKDKDADAGNTNNPGPGSTITEGDGHTHNYGEWIAEIPATCVESGVKGHYQCSGCNKYFDSDKRVITDLTIAPNPSAHSFGEWVNEVPATCTSTGVKGYKECEYCNNKFDESGALIDDLTIATDPSAHEWGEWQVTVKATCVSKGSEKRVCKLNILHEETRVTDEDLTAHNPNLRVVDEKAPDCIHPGYEEYTQCPDCGEKFGYVEIPASASAHEWNTHNICEICQTPWEYTENMLYEKNNSGDSYSLKGAQDIEKVVLPYYYMGLPVTSISSGAFKSHTNVKEIVFTDFIRNVGDNAFDWDNEVEKIYTPGIEAWCRIKFSSYYSNPLHCGAKLCLLGEDQPLTDIIIPEGVEKIEQYVFVSADVKSITLPDSVYSIGHHAFDNCLAEKIYLGNGISEINDYAFWGCAAELVWGDNPCRLSFDRGLDGYRGTKLFIHKNVEDIYFRDVDNLSEITVDPENKYFSSADNILYNKDGTKLIYVPAGKTDFTISDKVTSISSFAISDTEYYENQKNWSTVTDGSHSISVLYKDNCLISVEIGSINRFNGTLEIEPGTRVIANAAFRDSDLTGLVIPDSVTYIGESSFQRCSDLTSITFGDDSKLTTIGASAFRECTGLTSITFGNNSKLTTIGASAFYGCENLGSITIPASVTYVGGWAFSSCTSLESVDFGNDSQLTEIGDNVFENCTLLSSITFGDNSKLTTIGLNAFYGCENLETITIPAEVKVIGFGAFGECAKLASVTFENKVGWKVSLDGDMTETTDIAVNDDAQNAENLNSTYCYYFWLCN